ncbi:hypothetical protein Glove_327g26 [Diversispora epigaea]|uniref:HNH nuclease domain-containing protein n=1 Tax=Diversispora epigaea TaxID=1348612 RepID=A0A397HPF3_9GLOM|nr:hypothetical protein Glove_327g26 [Diversispora epigaea]
MRAQDIPELWSRGKQNTADGWCWIVSSLDKVQLPSGIITQGSFYAGYYRIGQVHKYRVHRLVALAFCPKEKGKEYVNHIDGDSTNNKASNLEWCTQKENMKHAVRLKLRANQYAIRQISADGIFQEFPSLAEAQRSTNINSQSISLVCREFQAQAGGYHWEYIKQ